MEVLGSDRSLFEAVARRRNRCDRLVARAVALGRTLYEAPIGSERATPEIRSASPSKPEDSFSDLPSMSEETIATTPVGDSLVSSLKEAPIEKSVEASSQGIGDSLYEILDELIPQVDFNAIPPTKPKRVLAKRSAMESEESESRTTPEAKESVDKGEETPKPAKRHKKKSASLLDSYFKGL